jgi:hypothetical protein
MALDDVVGAYTSAWNEKDEDACRSLLEKSWSEKGAYEDPTAAVEPGRAALHAHIAQFHKDYPGAKIVATSKPDQHHGKIHFTWKMVLPNGAVAIEGRDFGELDSAGRIAHIVGFFGPPPAL